LTQPADRHLREATAAVISMVAIAGITFLYHEVVDLSNAATVSTTFLLVVLTIAAVSTLRVAVAASLVAVLAFNYFFLPPVGTLTIADPDNWIALFAFLAVSVIASKLSTTARAKSDEAISRRNELARLFDLSRDVLLMTDSRAALSHLAGSIARRFDLDYAAIALPNGDDWVIAERPETTRVLDRRELSSAMAVAKTRVEYDAYERTYSGQREGLSDRGPVRLIPLRSGAEPVGILVAAGRAIEPGTLDALAGVVAIGVERARFLEERKAAELTRQREDLKTTILASVGHDLRTPLTAIKVAATNLQGPALSDADRVDQGQLILSEAERLARLFENLLDMARIDARAVTTTIRRAHPSEIIAAARDQVDRTMAGHRVTVTIDEDVPVAIDPQLVASALAHLLENAAQYTPIGTEINVLWNATPDSVTITVRDHGPGIADADLPHLFDRFFRGAQGTARHEGTGMGLWIARGLLAEHGGRVWAENCTDGGARFVINLPVPLATGSA